MISVGVTGGIGSGKTFVCRIFAILGIPVFDADEQAKNILQTDKSVKKGIIKLFGSAMYSENGIPDRKKLAELIFSDESALSAVNNMVHPVVKEHFHVWKNRFRSHPYIIKEAAILIETGTWSELDKIILVTAPAKLKIKRITERDHKTSDQIKNIMNRQLSDDQKLKFAHYKIINDENKLVIPQVLEIDRNIRKIT